MNHYNVLYRPKNAKPLDVEVFQCMAENYDHAEEQAEDANEGCGILWIDNEQDPEQTLQNWLSS